MKKLFLYAACAAALLCGARDTNRYDRVETRQGFEFSQRGGLGLSNEVVTAVDLRAVASNLSEGAVFVPFSNAVAKVTPPIELQAESDPHVSSWARKVGGADAPAPVSDARDLTHKDDFFVDLRTNRDDGVSLAFSRAVNDKVVHPAATKVYGNASSKAEYVDGYGRFVSRYPSEDAVLSAATSSAGGAYSTLTYRPNFISQLSTYHRYYADAPSLSIASNMRFLDAWFSADGGTSGCVPEYPGAVPYVQLTACGPGSGGAAYSWMDTERKQLSDLDFYYRLPLRLKVTSSSGSFASLYPVGSYVTVSNASGTSSTKRLYREGDSFPAAKLSGRDAVFSAIADRTAPAAEVNAASNMVVSFSAPQDFDATKLVNQDRFFDDLRTNRNAAATLSMSNAVVRFSPPASDPSAINDGTNVISASGKTYVRVFHPAVTNVTFSVLSFSCTGSSAGSMLTTLRKSVGNTLYAGEYVYYSGSYTNSNKSVSSFGGIGKYIAYGVPRSKYSMITSYSSYWNTGSDDSKISNSWNGDVLTISVQCAISSLESYYGTLTGTFRKNTDVVPAWSELVETGRIETESHVLSNFVQRSVKVNGTCLSNDVTIGYISDGTHRINADLTLGDGGRLAKVSEIGRQDAIVTNGVVLKDGYHWNRKVYADLTVVDDPVDKYVDVTNTDYATLPVPLTLSGRCGAPLYYNNEYEYPSDLWCTYTHTLSSSGATSAPYSYGIGDVASGNPDVKLKYMGLNVWNVSVDNWHLTGSDYLSFSTNIAFNLSSTVPGAKVFDFRVRKYHFTDATKTPPVEVWSEFRFEATVVSTNSNTYCKDSGNPVVEVVTRELAPRSTKTIATEDMVGCAVDGKDGKVWAVKAYDGHIYYVKED